MCVATKERIQAAFDNGILQLHSPEDAARFIAIARKGPNWKKHRGGHESFAVIEYLEALDRMLDNTFGSESLFSAGLPDVFYLNVGDAYTETLLWKAGGLCFGCWGNEVEAEDARRLVEDGELNCPSCGEWFEHEAETRACCHCGGKY